MYKDYGKKYGDTLLVLFTTSLYGKAKANTLSQYDGLKYWKRMGFTTGSSFQPSRKVFNMIWQWLKKNHTKSIRMARGKTTKRPTIKKRP